MGRGNHLVPSLDIIKAAKTYALNKPVVLEWGLGIEQNPNSLQTVRAVAILRGLTGNIDIPGGDILGMNIIRSYPTLKDKLPEGMLKKRLGAEHFKLLGDGAPLCHQPIFQHFLEPCGRVNLTGSGRF